MLTERFKTLEDKIAKLPPEQQDALAAALEDTLRQVGQQSAPTVADVRAAIERALEQHTASLLYLKDR